MTMAGSALINDFGKDVGKKFVKDKASSYMSSNGVSPDMQRMVIFAIDNSVEYIDLCAKQRKKPNDPAVLRDFLVSKGIFTLKMASEDLKCGVSLVELANNLRKNGPKAKGLIPSTIFVSLTLLDLISAGNSCSFLQEAWYHAFLQTSTDTINPIGVARRSEIKPAANPIDFLRLQDPHAKVRCDIERQDIENTQDDVNEQGPSLRMP
jgi:hypothetical protein